MHEGCQGTGHTVAPIHKVDVKRATLYRQGAHLKVEGILGQPGMLRVSPLAWVVAGWGTGDGVQRQEGQGLGWASAA